MGRKIVAVGVGLVLAASLMAPAAARKTRIAEVPYEFSPMSGAGVTAWFGETYGVYFGGFAEFPTKRKEHHVSISIQDDSGAPVAASVWQETGSDSDLDVQFCGESEKLHIVPGAPVKVQVFLEVTPTAPVCGAPELPTAGTITARF